MGLQSAKALGRRIWLENGWMDRDDVGCTCETDQPWLSSDVEWVLTALFFVSRRKVCSTHVSLTRRADMYWRSTLRDVHRYFVLRVCPSPSTRDFIDFDCAPCHIVRDTPSPTHSAGAAGSAPSTVNTKVCLFHFSALPSLTDNLWYSLCTMWIPFR